MSIHWGSDYDDKWFVSWWDQQGRRWHANNRTDKEIVGIVCGEWLGGGEGGGTQGKTEGPEVWSKLGLE